MTSPLSPEAVAQMVADLDLFSRCGDVGVMDRDMAIDAKAMLTTLAAENATLRSERDEARTWLGAANNEFGSAAWDWPDLWRRISQLKELSNSRWQSLNAAQDELATLRASEAAALEALAEIGAVVAAIEGADSLDKELIRNLKTRIAALAPTADKE